MAPMEPWQRVWIDANTFTTDIHSLINCTDCHQGQSVEDMDMAHTDMVVSPTEQADVTCAKCHPAITAAAANSLHNTLAGYDTVLHERSIPENHLVLEEMESYHCDSCHASCGDCHVSQPTSVGGGFLQGHTFLEEPTMSRNCTACHGSRVKDEYYGAHEEIPSDVHFRGRMACNDCHTGQEMHGITTADATHRYDGAQGPSCESCHQAELGAGSGILQHEIHGTESIACQVCHSVSYTNCSNCHVERNEENTPFFSVEENWLGFYIARNELRNSDRPYEYVTVRHVPIDEHSFSFYGENLLPNFSNRSTWAYTTPHNTQRITPQTQRCTSCHGNDAVFLTADKVAPEELAANTGIIVPAAPPLPEGYEDVITGEATPTQASESDGGDFWGDGSSETQPTEPPAGDFWGDSGATTPTPEGDFWGGDAEPATQPTEESNFWGSDNTTNQATPSNEGGSFWDN